MFKVNFNISDIWFSKGHRYHGANAYTIHADLAQHLGNQQIQGVEMINENVMQVTFTIDGAMHHYITNYMYRVHNKSANMGEVRKFIEAYGIAVR